MAFPLATLAAQISFAGISAPPFADVLASLQASFRNIYGQDVYLGNDTQDGQMLAVFARAIFDANQTAIAVYNSFSPATAFGDGLSSVVKINGIKRLASSASTVALLIGGSVGTVIVNGAASDTSNNTWQLPSSVTIPPAGSILVTGLCTKQGAIPAAVGTVTTIATPTLGWSTVSNPSAASLGAPVETDAQLRQRQTVSVGLPALTVLQSTLAAILALPGVTGARIYENDTNATDANGLPPHSIAAVVNGGNVSDIASAIALKKTPGAFTYGTTTQVVTDNAGVPHTINFFIPSKFPITVAVTIKAFTGFSTATGQALRQAVVDYINNVLTIGQNVYIARLYLPAQLNGDSRAAQYELTGLTVNGGSVDVAIPFNAQAVATLATVSLTVT